MKPEYKTVKEHGIYEYETKKSRFIANVMPVTTEESAQEFLNSIRSQHKTAAHNVYAYVLQEGNIDRFSDAGEPSGTAGLPVLDAMRKRGITDCAVVVTRYFGGTLLGGGGLVRAYGHSASGGVTAARPILCKLCDIFSVSCDYHLQGKVEYALRSGPHTIEDTLFDTHVTYIVCVSLGLGEAFINEMTEVTSGGAITLKIDHQYTESEVFENG